MAAGMGAAVGAGKGQAGDFRKRQGIDVLPQSYGLAGLAAPDDGRAAGLQFRQFLDLDAIAGQFFFDKRRGLHFFIAQFRVPVDLPPDFYRMGKKLFYQFLYRLQWRYPLCMVIFYGKHIITVPRAKCKVQGEKRR